MHTINAIQLHDKWQGIKINMKVKDAAIKGID